jgi:hypothetical protein
MSRLLEDRVMAAHPLPPADRMILWMIAQAVPEGQQDVLVNRADLARRLDARPPMIGHALLAGEQLGLCRVLRGGRIEFRTGDLFTPAPVPSSPEPLRAVRPAPPLPPSDHPSPQEAIAEFKRQWEAVYGQTFVPESWYYKSIRPSTETLTRTELWARMRRFLADRRPFYVDRKHAFSSFTRDINQFVAESAPARSRVPDVEATRRYQEEMRRRANGERRS